MAEADGGVRLGGRRGDGGQLGESFILFKKDSLLRKVSWNKPTDVLEK